MMHVCSTSRRIVQQACSPSFITFKVVLISLCVWSSQYYLAVRITIWRRRQSRSSMKWCVLIWFIPISFALVLSRYWKCCGQVKKRTSDLNSYTAGSHVMEYGDTTFKDEKLYLYQGFNPANANMTNKLFWQAPRAAINQRDADLLFLWRRVWSSFVQYFQSFLSKWLNGVLDFC